MKVALMKPRVLGTRPNIEKAVHMIGGTLPVLAAHTPDEDVDLQAFDENLDARLDLMDKAKGGFDLVGISVMTPAATRAYKLADHYRSRGMKVVLGGAHVTAMPDEALQHADAISVFNGEQTWPAIIEDYRRGELKEVYKNEFVASGEKDAPLERKLPKRNILKPSFLSRPKVLIESVATSTGCIYTCKFCMIPVMYGRKHIAHPIASVIDDIRGVAGKRIFLNDDNFMGNPKAAEALFKAMIELRERTGEEKEWYSQSTIVLGKKPELAKLARESGCRGIYIGFESVNDMSVKNDVGKGCNRVRDYEDAIHVLQDNGIRVEGGFVFGFENDDLGTFERTLEFVDRVGLDSVNPHILTPHPGTEVYADLMQQGRIFDYGNWQNFYTGRVVFDPKMMRPEDLQEGYDEFCREAYSLRRMLNRAFGNFPSEAGELVENVRGVPDMFFDSMRTLAMNVVGKPVLS